MLFKNRSNSNQYSLELLLILVSLLFVHNNFVSIYFLRSSAGLGGGLI